MTETSIFNYLDLDSWGNDFIRLSVPTGQIREFDILDVTKQPGIQFPGVLACTPLVLWSIGSERALAIHWGAPGMPPDTVDTHIRNHIRMNKSTIPWKLHAAIIIPTDEELRQAVEEVSGRKENIDYLERFEGSMPNVTIERQIIHAYASNLSFRAQKGFMINK